MLLGLVLAHVGQVFAYSHPPPTEEFFSRGRTIEDFHQERSLAFDLKILALLMVFIGAAIRLLWGYAVDEYCCRTQPELPSDPPGPIEDDSK